MTGGHWCGSGSGYSVYYSEMSAIALTLSIGGPSGIWSGLPRNVSQAPPPGQFYPEDHHLMQKTTTVKGDKTVMASAQQPLEFDFKIRYKFIPRHLATVR